MKTTMKIPRMARTRSQTAKSGKSTKFKWCNTMSLEQCRKRRSCKIVRNKHGRLMCKCKCQETVKPTAPA